SSSDSSLSIHDGSPDGSGAFAAGAAGGLGGSAAGGCFSAGFWAAGFPESSSDSSLSIHDGSPVDGAAGLGSGGFTVGAPSAGSFGSGLGFDDVRGVTPMSSIVSSPPGASVTLSSSGSGGSVDLSDLVPRIPVADGSSSGLSAVLRRPARRIADGVSVAPEA